jgi:PBP4 family serine-type D-alanyl-D-alanine carboxypeptidase
MTKRGLPVILAGTTILAVAGIVNAFHSGHGASEVRASTTVAAIGPMQSTEPSPDTVAAPLPVLAEPSGVEVSSSDSARMLAKLADQIQASINLPAELKSAHVGILVRSLSTDKQIYALNEERPLTPASTTKVVTAFTALSELGSDFRIRTILAAAEKPKDGVLAGDLFVKGYGDPFLSSADVDALADQLVAQGVREIDGNIVGDGTYYDSKYDRTEYSGDPDEVEDLPPISALAVENNRFSVVVSAPRTAGEPVMIQTYPRSSGFDIANHAVATAARAARRSSPRRSSTRRRGRKVSELLDPASTGSSIFRTASYVTTGGGASDDELLAYAASPARRPAAKKPAKSGKAAGTKRTPAKSKAQASKGTKKKSRTAAKAATKAAASSAASSTGAQAGSLKVAVVGGRDQRQVIQVTGGLLAGRSASYRYEMKNPPLVVAGIVYDRLRARGVSIKGRATSGATPQHFKMLGEHERPLTQVLTQMLKQSDNYLAEVVFKMIGASAGGHQETAKQSLQKISRRMSISQIPFGMCVINDGSGLSRANCLSASTLTGILSATYHDPKVFQAFYSAMSIAGVDGTLRRRMKGTPAEGNVHGKTGTLRNVSALTGYATTKDGEVIAFAMLMNGGNHGAYRTVQDKIAERIASFSYADAAPTVTSR